VSKAGNVAAARHAPLLSARFDRAAHGQADWSVADGPDAQDPRGREEGCALQACAALRVRLAGDINAKMDSASLDELLESIKSELTRLGPLIGLEVVRPRGQCPACAQTRFAH
jgi:hypothetical protein